MSTFISIYGVSKEDAYDTYVMSLVAEPQSRMSKCPISTNWFNRWSNCCETCLGFILKKDNKFISNLCLYWLNTLKMLSIMILPYRGKYSIWSWVYPIRSSHLVPLSEEVKYWSLICTHWKGILKREISHKLELKALVKKFKLMWSLFYGVYLRANKEIVFIDWHWRVQPDREYLSEALSVYYWILEKKLILSK